MFFPQERNPIDLLQCDKEPIHIPGMIQAHGFLLALQEPDLTIVQLSDNVQTFLHRAPAALLGLSLSEVIGHLPYHSFHHQLSTKGSLKELNPLSFVLQIEEREQTFEVTLHRSNGLLILEFEPAFPHLDNNAQQFHQKILAVIQKLKIAPDLPTLFKSIVEEVKELTGFDRVMVYQFHSTDGTVIAEAKEASLEPYEGLHYPASDIPQQARTLFLKNPLRIISDVHYTPSSLFPAHNPIIHAPLDLSFAILRGVSPIHIQYLKNMCVQASMTLSIIINHTLWGLITCHHYQPKLIHYDMRFSCELLSQVLSWQIAALQTKSKNDQLKAQSQQLESIYEIVTHHNFWYDAFLQNHEHLLKLVNAEGLAIGYDGRYALFGKTPTQNQIIKLLSRIHQTTTQRVFQSACLTSLYPSAQHYKDTASGVLISLVSPSEGDVILWFRPEMLQTVHWAGNPHKPVLLEEGHARLLPRQSFAKWQEEVQYQSLPWSHTEIEIVNQLTLFLSEIKLKHFYRMAREYQVEKATFAEKMREHQEDFIDRVCHEIRNPINGIVGSLELARHQLDKMKTVFDQMSSLNRETSMLYQHLTECYQNMDNIHECVTHQTVITDDVLSLSKLEQKKVSAECIACDIIHIIRSAAKMFDAVFQKKGLKLIYEGIIPTLWVKSDPKKLKQILINLISNALKFTQQGQVVLSLRCLSDSSTEAVYQINVKDTGTGIPLHEQGRLFQRFEQANAQIAGKYGGSGLGLSISRELTHLLGGKIWFKSTFGEGTCFSFTFQVKKLTSQEKHELSSNQASPKAQNENVVRPSSSKKILIVEDNLINQKVLNVLLTQAGYSCDMADNGLIALEKYKYFSYPIILMDIQMPVMDGYQATQSIRDLEKTQNGSVAYIIGLSANIGKTFKQKALKAGMNTYISKPFNKKDILAILRLRTCPSPQTSSPPLPLKTIFSG